MKKNWVVFCAFFKAFSERRCAIMAAALTYSTLLSLVPLLLVTATVMSYFPQFHGMFELMRDFIINNFVADSAKLVSHYVDDFSNQVRVLPWKNILALSILSILMVYNLVRAFNLVWQVRLRRHLAFSLVIYFFVLLLLPVALGALMLLSTYIASMPLITNMHGGVHVEKPLLNVLPYLISLLTFTIFNWVLPSCRVKLHYALVAGAVTTLLFEVGKYGFTLYIHYFNSYRVVYGALAAIPIFLLWLYLSWTMILIGALVCNFLHREPKNHI